MPWDVRGDWGGDSGACLGGGGYLVEGVQVVGEPGEQPAGRQAGAGGDERRSLRAGQD